MLCHPQRQKIDEASDLRGQMHAVEVHCADAEFDRCEVSQHPDQPAGRHVVGNDEARREAEALSAQRQEAQHLGSRWDRG